MIDFTKMQKFGALLGRVILFSGALFFKSQMWLVYGSISQNRGEVMKRKMSILSIFIVIAIICTFTLGVSVAFADGETEEPIKQKYTVLAYGGIINDITSERTIEGTLLLTLNLMKVSGKITRLSAG